VLDLYRKIKALGADAVFRLMDLRLTTMEAGDLLEKMAFIEGVIAEIREEERGNGK